MKTAKFEIGYKTWHSSLYGGTQEVEVVGRTENTVTIRTSWIAEDTGELCNYDRTLDIETEVIGGVEVECAVVWTYGEAKGYIHCITEDEIMKIHNNEKENENMNTNTFTINGATYTTNATGKYFYVTDDTRFQKRVSRKGYEEAKAAYEEAVAIKMHENLEKLNREQNKNNEFTEITEEDLRRDDEELEKLVAETEKSNADEEAERILDEMAEDDGITAEEFIEKLQKVEKEKKVRKAKKDKAAKKNAAYNYCESGEVVVTLTEKQVDFIRHLPDTCFWEQGLDSCIWVDCLCDEIGGQFAGKPMTVGAMISTICEKGLGNRAVNRKGPRGGKCTSFALTELGKLVAAELGLN